MYLDPSGEHSPCTTRHTVWRLERYAPALKEDLSLRLKMESVVHNTMQILVDTLTYGQ